MIVDDPAFYVVERHFFPGTFSRAQLQVFTALEKVACEGLESLRLLQSHNQKVDLAQYWLYECAKDCTGLLIRKQVGFKEEVCLEPAAGEMAPYGRSQKWR